MKENEKYDILLTGQLEALTILEKRFDWLINLDEKNIETTIYDLIDSKSAFLDKEYYGYMIVLASLALKKIKEEEK